MLLELELEKVTATLEHLNCRTEKSGPDDVPAATLKITCPQSADILAFFSPVLKTQLFTTEKDLAGERLAIRDEHIEYPLGLDHEMTGAGVMIEYGLGTMRLTDCTITEFRLTPMDGGSIILGFKVNCRPDAQQIGHLYVLQKKGITFTLEPPEPAEMSKAA